MALTAIRLDFQSDFLAKGLAVGILVRPFAIGVVPGDAVYQRSDGVAQKASAASQATMPAFGIVEAIDSPLPGQAIIRYDGDSSVIGGLLAGEIYLVGTTAGSIVSEGDTGSPDYPGASGNVQQQIGLASGPMLLFMRVSLFKVEIN